MILLDTCALIYVSQGEPVIERAMEAIDTAAQSNGLHVSPISAWEIGNLSSKGKLALTTDPLRFFKLFIEKTGAELCEMDCDLLIQSSFLPGQIHKDPMDRILIATARKLNMPLLTSDGAILAYGAEGHVKTVAC